MTRNAMKDAINRGFFLMILEEFDRLKAIEDAKTPDVLPCRKCGLDPVCSYRCWKCEGDAVKHALSDWNAANVDAKACPFCDRKAIESESRLGAKLAKCEDESCAGANGWTTLGKWNRRPEAKP